MPRARPKYYFWGYSPDSIASAVARVYSKGPGAMRPVGSRGNAPGQGSGAKPAPEAKNYLELSKQHCALDLTT